MNKQGYYYHQPNYYYPHYDPYQRLYVQPTYPSPHASLNQHVQETSHKMRESYGKEQIEQSNENKALDYTEQTLGEQIKKIYDKLNQIEEENKQLKEKIEKIQPVTIENINYKIQDLSVKDLSGTLLVGLTSLSDAENLKKLLQGNDSIELSDLDTEDTDMPIDQEDEDQL
ncbi:spore germination protein GerPC [Bacillus sp. AK128]